MNKNFALFVLTSAVVGCNAANNASDGGTEPPPDTGGSSEGGGDSAAPNDASDAGGDSSTPGDSISTADSGTKGDPPAATSSSTGTLFAGNPTYGGEPIDRPPTGTGTRAHLRWQCEERART